VNIGGYVLNVALVNSGTLMVASEKPHFQLTVWSCAVDDLGWPVRVPFLLSIKNSVKRSAGLGEPVLVTLCVGKPVAVSTGGDFTQICGALSEHLFSLVCHSTVVSMVDDYIMHNILYIRPVLVDDSVVLSLAFIVHLVQVDMALE